MTEILKGPGIDIDPVELFWLSRWYMTEYWGRRMSWEEMDYKLEHLSAQRPDVSFSQIALATQTHQI
jgi:hypothetical protein